MYCKFVFDWISQLHTSVSELIDWNCCIKLFKASSISILKQRTVIDSIVLHSGQFLDDYFMSI